MVKKISSIFNILLISVIAVAAIDLTSCNDDDTVSWNHLPTGIAEFISQYFPGSSVQSYSPSPTGYHVRLSNGPGMTFNKTFQWETINGYGMPLPQVLLFDQLPPALYEYLSSISALNDVFAVSRDVKNYTVELLNTSVVYNIATQEITGLKS